MAEETPTPVTPKPATAAAVVSSTTPAAPKPAAPAAPTAPKPAAPVTPKAPPPPPSPRKIYADEMEAKLKEQYAKIDQWKALVSTATREDKYRYQRPLEVITNKWGVLFMKVEELKRASDDKLDALKPGVEAAAKALADAIASSSPKLP